MDVGCYGVNAARWLFGAEATEVVGQQIVDDEYSVDLSFGAVLRFHGNRQAVVASSSTRAPSNTYTIEGPEGSLRVERAFRPDTNRGLFTINTARTKSRSWRKSRPTTSSQGRWTTLSKA